MHLGNVFCALMAWLDARAQGEAMLLRIEDLDPDRCKREYALTLMEDLRYLGLDWDEGGDLPAYYQSNRREIYEWALNKLREKGIVYPCFCTRAQLHAASAPHASDGQTLYAGTCAAGLLAAICMWTFPISSGIFPQTKMIPLLTILRLRIPLSRGWWMLR